MKLRLVQWLALGNALAVALTALVLVGYFTYQDYQALHRQMLERSRELAAGLTTLVEFPLFTGDRQLLERQLDRFLDNPLVTGIEVSDAQGRPLVRRGDPRPSDGITLLREVRTEALDSGDEALGLETVATPVRLGTVRLGVSLAQTRDRQWALLGQSAFILLLGLALGGGLSWWLGRRLARPIQQLTAAADDLAAGHLERRVADHGPLEVAALAHHFNDMAEALGQAHEEMRREVERATAALQRSLRRLEDKNRELEAARQAAQAASDAKSRFLANMSHEIRTPMNAIVGFTRLLYKSSPDPAQRHHLLTIQHSAESLLTLIDDILELAQMEKGNVHLRAVDYDLRVVLDDVCALLAPLAHEKQLELALLIHDDVPTALNGDPCRLKQILNNLIGNAIKYTPAGEVVIRVARETDAPGTQGVRLKFSVSDTGIGIDEEQRARIFEAFSQGDEAVTRSYEGTGLGLAIARSLVVRMGGEIDFHSRPGMGTTFWFTIWSAVQDAATEAPAPLAGHQVVLVEGHEVSRLALLHDLHRLGLEVYAYPRLEEAETSTHWARAGARLVAVGSPRRLSSDELRHLAGLLREPAAPTLILANSAALADYQTLAQAGIPTPLNKPVPRDLLSERLRELLLDGRAGAPERRDERPLRQGRVIVCEDNPVNRALYLALFQDLGLTPVLVDSAEAALAALQKDGADVVIMDVHMPGMSGLEAIRRLRALPPPLDRTPVVCVSADVYSREGCLEAGADAFLAKPIDEAALAALLRVHLPAAPPSPKADPKAHLHQRLLPLLREALPAHLEALRSAWARHDQEALRSELHKLHGACVYCRVPALLAAVRDMEAAVKEGRGDPETALSRLEEAIQRLMDGDAPD